MRVLVTGASRGLGIVVANHFNAVTMGRSDCALDYDSPIPDVEVAIHCGGGGLGLKSPFLSADEFHRLFVANLGQQAEINRRVIPQMLRRGSGYICHVCSIASGEAVGSVGYNTVKAALAAYVRSLGREMAPHNIVVTGIAPGGFQRPGGAMERLEANNPEAHRDFERDRLPRGYFAKAEELLPLIKLLTSADGSMMAGCVVPIDAGEGRYYG